MKIETLKDFASCSVFHHFRHQAEARIPKQAGVTERFEAAMQQTVNYLWHQVQNGTYPTAHLMKLAWGRAWAPGRTKEEILFYVTSWRDEAKKRERQGLRYALALREYYQANPGRSILIGREYQVPFGKRRTLEGTIDLVREVDGLIELVAFRVDSKPLKHFVKNDYGITGAAWATRKLLGRPPDRMIVHHLPTGQILETSRSDVDYRALHQTVRMTEDAIAAGHRIPVLNSTCVGCPYLGPCERKEWLTP